MGKPESEAKARGAVTSKTSWRQAWLRHHWISCTDSLARMLATPLQSLLTWLVVAIALALPAALYLGLQNIQQLGENWQSSAQMSAFMKWGAKPKAIESLVTTLEKTYSHQPY